MVLMSYIVATAWELALVLKTYREGLVFLSAGFAVLFIMSSVSISVDNSKTGEKLREELRKMGVPSERYDYWSNWIRAFIYLFTVDGAISYGAGLGSAYVTVIGFSAYAAMKVFGKKQ